jgi:hypothetical protein
LVGRFCGIATSDLLTGRMGKSYSISSQEIMVPNHYLPSIYFEECVTLFIFSSIVIAECKFGNLDLLFGNYVTLHIAKVPPLPVLH